MNKLLNVNKLHLFVFSFKLRDIKSSCLLILFVRWGTAWYELVGNALYVRLIFFLLYL